MYQKTIQNQINLGFDFLKRRQYAFGAWESYASPKPDLSEHYLLTDLFTTAYITREIAEAVQDSHDPNHLVLFQNACNFLATERRDNGLWRFYKRGELRLLPTDFDTSSCTASALIAANYDIDLSSVYELLEAHRHPDGGYWVYAMPPVAPKKNWIYPIPKNCYPEYTVNTHIFVFLVMYQKDYQYALDFLLDALRNKTYETRQLFYDLPLVFLYNLVRGVAMTPEWDTLRPELLTHTLRHVEPIMPNTLQNAWVLDLLCTFGLPEKQVAPYAQAILQSQTEDGAWQGGYLHHNPILYFGSPEITTAFVIRALHQYAKGYLKDKRA